MPTVWRPDGSPLLSRRGRLTAMTLMTLSPAAHRRPIASDRPPIASQSQSNRPLLPARKGPTAGVPCRSLRGMRMKLRPQLLELQAPSFCGLELQSFFDDPAIKTRGPRPFAPAA